MMNKEKELKVMNKLKSLKEILQNERYLPK